MKLLCAALVSRLQLTPQLVILLLQPRLDLYMYIYTEVMGVYISYITNDLKLDYLYISMQ